MKSDERLAFEADRLRMRLEFRIITKQVLNQLEDELAVIHYNANQKGVIPEVTLEHADLREVTNSITRLKGVLGIEAPR